MAIDLDTNTAFGKRVSERLEQELIVWLTTINTAGAPVPIPVWFLWDNESFLIYSQPGTPKLRNIAANPKVSLHFNSDDTGDDIVVVSGNATTSDDPRADAVSEYIAKYRGLIADYDWTPESFASDYSVPIRVTPTRLRGH